MFDNLLVLYINFTIKIEEINRKKNIKFYHVNYFAKQILLIKYIVQKYFLSHVKYLRQ